LRARHRRRAHARTAARAAERCTLGARLDQRGSALRWPRRARRGPARRLGGAGRLRVALPQRQGSGVSGRASGTLHLKWRAGDPPALLRDREWLTCNGLGGFASGALLGIPTRRYHGILVPNLAQPKGRHIMLSRLDERVLAGECTARLSGAQFLDGGVESDCHAYLTEFSLQWQVPTWTFEIAGRRLR